jgi:hypothetical protein
VILICSLIPPLAANDFYFQFKEEAKKPKSPAVLVSGLAVTNLHGDRWMSNSTHLASSSTVTCEALQGHYGPDQQTSVRTWQIKMAIAGWFSRERKENYGKEQILLDIEQAVLRLGDVADF